MKISSDLAVVEVHGGDHDAAGHSHHGGQHQADEARAEGDQLLAQQ